MIAQEKNKPKERYLKIPYSILNIGGLGLSEKVLLAYINGFGRQGCYQSNATLAKVFFTNTKQIQRWVKRIHNYITVKCPHGYYRTMWVKGNSDVIEGQKEWQKKQDIRRAKRLSKKPRSSRTDTAHYCKESDNAAVGQIRPTGGDKSVLHSRTNPSVEPGQIRPTIKNHIIKEITKEVTALPTPSPAERASAVLKDRTTEQQKDVEKFMQNFGKKKQRTGLSPAEVNGRKQELLKQLAGVK